METLLATTNFTSLRPSWAVACTRTGDLAAVNPLESLSVRTDRATEMVKLTLPMVVVVVLMGPMEPTVVMEVRRGSPASDA